MKLFSRTASLATLAAAFMLGAPALVCAQAEPLGNGGGKYVNRQSETNRFAFSAVLLPNGSVKGHAVFHFPAARAMVKMEVTSFRSIGNQLILVGHVTKAVNTPRKDLVGSTAFVAFRDGLGIDGHTGFSALPLALGRLDVDQVAKLLGLTGQVPSQLFFPVVKGNIKIH